VISGRAYEIATLAYVRRHWWSQALQVLSEKARLGVPSTESERRTAEFLAGLQAGDAANRAGDVLKAVLAQQQAVKAKHRKRSNSR
jgi:hypothetical protein